MIRSDDPITDPVFMKFSRKSLHASFFVSDFRGKQQMNIARSQVPFYFLLTENLHLDKLHVSLHIQYRYYWFEDFDLMEKFFGFWKQWRRQRQSLVSAEFSQALSEALPRFCKDISSVGILKNT